MNFFVIYKKISCIKNKIDYLMDVLGKYIKMKQINLLNATFFYFWFYFFQKEVAFLYR